MENLELELIEAYTNENYHSEALMIKAISQGRFDLLKDIAKKLNRTTRSIILKINKLKKENIC